MSRNSCAALDQCLSDRDCPEDSLCSCGQVGNANFCNPGNCRTDDDCASGFTCEHSYCHTPKDTCKKTEDCTSPREAAVCDYDTTKRAWGCRVIPQIPPG
jgi:hypothetical protein